jgi:5'-nucleotidase
MGGIMVHSQSTPKMIRTREMNILVTNDDGVTAPGLLSLAQEMRKIGNIFVLAPDHNWSASGHVKTLDRPLRVSEIKLEDGTMALTTDGAPSDCVALALLGILTEKIDLVVSGINPRANLGHDVTYSGTVTAAMEAAIWGIPGLAFSLDSPENHLGDLDYSVAGKYAGHIVSIVKYNRLPSGILLNINIPFLPEDEIKGIMITRQGLRVYRDKLDKRLDPRGRPYYWIGGDAPTGIPDEGTDFGALDRGYVSVTPLQLDLTAWDTVKIMKDWDWSIPK